MRYRSYTAGPDDDQKRLDRIIRAMFPDVPLSAVARMIRTGDVRINGSGADHNSRVSAGDTIEAPERFGASRNERRLRDEGRRPVERDRSDRRDGRTGTAGRAGREERGGHSRRRGHEGRLERPGRTPGRPHAGGSDHAGATGDGRRDSFPPVIHRDADLLVLNKPAGMAVHGPRSLTTLVVRRADREGWTRSSLSFRPGPVHRLDRESSGVQLFALSVAGARRTATTFAGRSARKFYLTVAGGKVERRLECKEPIRYDRSARTAIVGEGKSARTAFVPIAYRPEVGCSLVVAVPRTGRTHQIRAHAAALGHPLVGDRRYAGASWPAGRAMQFHLLHHLALVLPTEGEHARMYQAGLAPETWRFVEALFGDSAPIEERLRTVIAALCTDLAPGTTIKL